LLNVLSKSKEDVQVNEISRYFVSVLAARLEQKAPFIQVVIGPRQVGKTTGVKSISRLLPTYTFHYASADLPYPPQADWIISEWQSARHAAKQQPTALVLDEVQKVPRWSEVIKGLYDEDRHNQNLSVIVLGSASLLMQEGLTESLLGRFELIRVPHWDLAESVQSFNWDFEHYIAFGGYPAPARLISEPERWQTFMRDAILEPLISRDLLALRSVAKTALLRQTLNLALSYPAQELSFNKMIGQLHDAGNTVTVKSYLELLEGAFLLKLLYKYSTRQLSRRSSSPKILPLCPALVHAAVSPQKVMHDPEWYGRMFECCIGAHLLHISNSEVFYWREGSSEVDFIVVKNDKVLAIEVKSTKNRQREGLSLFKSKFPGAYSLVLTKDLGLLFLQQPHSSDLWNFLMELAQL
jgi:uncharacterized protein